jgi:hypothetical protein
MKPKPIAREGVASPTLRHTLNPFQIRRSHGKQDSPSNDESFSFFFSFFLSFP